MLLVQMAQGIMKQNRFGSARLQFYLFINLGINAGEIEFQRCQCYSQSRFCFRLLVRFLENALQRPCH